MRKHRIIALTLAIFAIRAICIPAIAGEEKEDNVSIDKIPAAAAAALKAAAGGADISSVELDDEDGKIKGYEAAFTVDGHKREVASDAKGNIYSTEDTISLSDVPGAAQAAINAQANGDPVTSVERAQENGAVTYEAVIKGVEYEFSGTGKLLGKESEGGEGKD
jgi:uncharacterized membrane protein YkoI